MWCDWVQYYDKVIEMDWQVGWIFKQFEDDGFVDDMIIFYYGDYGSGMLRSKCWFYNFGLNVLLIVYILEKYQFFVIVDFSLGEKNDWLVGFIDFVLILFSVCGVELLSYFQG